MRKERSTVLPPDAMEVGGNLLPDQDLVHIRQRPCGFGPPLMGHHGPRQPLAGLWERRVSD